MIIASNKKVNLNLLIANYQHLYFTLLSIITLVYSLLVVISIQNKFQKRRFGIFYLFHYLHLLYFILNCI